MTPDHSFLMEMIAHHEDALRMANAVLRAGKDPGVLALARQIIDAQTAEILRMRVMMLRLQMM